MWTSENPVSYDRSTLFEYFDLWDYDGTLIVSTIRYTSDAAKRWDVRPVSRIGMAAR